jgi:hypothetical protein
MVDKVPLRYPLPAAPQARELAGWPATLTKALYDIQGKHAQTLNAILEGQQPVVLPSHTVATVPAAASYTGALIFVSNEAGGAVPAFSDGTSWRRVTDRAVIS